MLSQGAPIGPHIAIVGSRQFPDAAAVERYVAALPDDAVVVSGGAEGVDTIAAEAAKASGLKVVIYEADWSLGRKAGPMRNAEIVKHSDRVVAFWNGESRGTLSTILLAHWTGLPIEIYGPNGEPVPVETALAAAEANGVRIFKGDNA